MRPSQYARSGGTRTGAARAGSAFAAFLALLAPAAGAQDRPAAGDTVRTPSFGTARGRVVDAATGAPVSNAELRFSRADGAAGGGGADTAATRADAQGRWQVALPAGRYRARVRALGRVPREVGIEIALGRARDGAEAGARPGERSGVRSPEHTIALDAAALALDAVVVTAARREQRLADVVVATEVVTRADIARTGAADLASVLVEQTGVQLQGGHPAGAGVMLQGFGAERVLVLVDGQPVAGRLSGVFDVSRIPTAAVERVEVVKGPQSTLYGTDAMGGVINIVTRAPTTEALGGSLTFTGGTQARRDGTAAVTLGRGSVAGTLTLGSRSTETAPGRADALGALARRADAAAKLRWTPAPDLAVEGSVLALDERQRWRAGSLYTFGDNQQWSGRLNAAWQRGVHRLAPTLSASVHDHLARGSSEPKPIAGDPGQRQRQRVYQAELLYNTRFGTATRAPALDVGVQLRRDETEAERVPGGLRAQTVVEPFAQAEVAAAPGLAVVPGVRLTRSAQWGTRLTPRLAARYRVPGIAGERFTFRASAGTGFRAPDFKELYMRFVNQGAGYAVNGNPDLRPESSRNVTAGAEWAAVRGYLRGQLFWNRFRDFIETRPVSGLGTAPVYEYGNVDDGTTRGAELEAGTVLAGLRLEGGYAALATRDAATGHPLLGRPAHSVRATASYAFGRLARGALPTGPRMSVTGVVTGRTPMERDAATGLVTGWRDAFLRADLRLAQPLPGGAELVLGADNLFDARPAQWAGFTGRHLYTGLSWAPTLPNGR